MDNQTSGTTSSPTPTATPTDNSSAVTLDAAVNSAPTEPAASTPTDPAPSTDTPSNSSDSSPETPSDSSDSTEILTKVAEKIAASQNVLIALSSDPSVDELATAIGLSLFLDRLGKRATAIYSGTTPNVLEFLKPSEVFETSADTLQDFVIAINKEKADHLRYKLDGDYVKIFITPYRNRISETDLNFSYGDFNVDLVLALNVESGVDLDSALREYGRIMHDAIIIDVTTGKPGKLGEIEWSDPKASSVAEMISRMLTTVTNETIEKDEATAFLTGIVAATKRFSNSKTSPETMKIASDLMRSGADQQLVSKNITPDLDNMMYDAPTSSSINLSSQTSDTSESTTSDSTDASTSDDSETTSPIESSESTTPDLAATPDSSEPTATPDSPEPTSDSSDLSSDTPTISLSTPPDDKLEVSHDDSTSSLSEPSSASPSEPATTSESDTSETPVPETASTPDTSADDSDLLKDLKDAEQALTSTGQETIQTPEQVIALSTDSNPVDISSISTDLNPTPEPIPASIPSPTPESVTPSSTDPGSPTIPTVSTDLNPASAATPAVPTNPEINGVPEINYATPADAEILPPPPTPPIDMNATLAMPPADPAPTTPAASTPEPTTTPSIPAVDLSTSVANPVAAPVATTPDPSAPPVTSEPTPAPTSDPAAFKIPV